MTKSWKVSTLIFATACLLWTVTATADPKSVVPWDEQASQELEVALHGMHEVWNTGDIASLKKLIVGDDVLVTFELDPATHSPIRLASREELWSFVDGIVTNLEDESAVSLLGDPTVHCRATGDWGICTEECSVTVRLPDGVEEHHKLLSTATAVKFDDGWKWVQWHMSTGGPIETYRDGVKVASN
jgi:hypothetical protein